MERIFNIALKSDRDRIQIDIKINALLKVQKALFIKKSDAHDKTHGCTRSVSTPPRAKSVTHIGNLQMLYSY